VIEIKFKLLQSALEPYQTLIQTMDRSGASGQTFDLLITPKKTEAGDSLVIELSRNSAYGIAEIKDGVQIECGENQSILLSSAAFNALPKNQVENEPIEFRISDRIYCTYPNDGQMESIKFDFEYSDNPGIFQRRDAVALMAGFNQEALKKFSGMIESASGYVYKKRMDEPMSTLKVTLTSQGMAKVEATTGTEAFYAEEQITGFNSLQGDQVLSCLLHPATWLAGTFLGTRQKQDLYVGFDTNSITFLSGTIAFTHARMSFTDYPEIGDQIKAWIGSASNESFRAKINPAAFRSKLQYLESIGLAAKAMEPSFIMSNDKGKPYLQLKGFISSGSSKIVDSNIIEVNWVKDDAKIKLPARLVISILATAEQHGLTDFYDLQGSPGVFFVNPNQSVFVLMSQESPE
jgi:hypothetical protein